MIADGNHIIIKVNGKTTVDWTDPKNTYTKGHFALQQHDPGTVVKFRKIEVKELPERVTSRRRWSVSPFVQPHRGCTDYRLRFRQRRPASEQDVKVEPGAPVAEARLAPGPAGFLSHFSPPAPARTWPPCRRRPR